MEYNPIRYILLPQFVFKLMVLVVDKPALNLRHKMSQSPRSDLVVSALKPDKLGK